MTRISILAPAWVCLASFATSPSLAANSDWRILPRGNARNINANTKVTLLNLTHPRALQYGKRGSIGGINLVWASQNARPACITFRRASGSNEPLKFGEPLAIHVEGGGYLVYRKRNLGINFGWSKSPVYQFEIRGGSGLVPAGAAVAIFNQVEGDVLVYCKRIGKVINLAWSKDCHNGVRPPKELFDAVEDVAGDAAKAAAVGALTGS